MSKNIGINKNVEQYLNNGKYKEFYKEYQDQIPKPIQLDDKNGFADYVINELKKRNIKTFRKYQTKENEIVQNFPDNYRTKRTTELKNIANKIAARIETIKKNYNSYNFGEDQQTKFTEIEYQLVDTNTYIKNLSQLSNTDFNTEIPQNTLNAIETTLQKLENYRNINYSPNLPISNPGENSATHSDLLKNPLPGRKNLLPVLTPIQKVNKIHKENLSHNLHEAVTQGTGNVTTPFFIKQPAPAPGTNGRQQANPSKDNEFLNIRKPSIGEVSSLKKTYISHLHRVMVTIIANIMFMLKQTVVKEGTNENEIHKAKDIFIHIPMSDITERAISTAINQKKNSSNGIYLTINPVLSQRIEIRTDDYYFTMDDADNKLANDTYINTFREILEIALIPRASKFINDHDQENEGTKRSHYKEHLIAHKQINRSDKLETIFVDHYRNDLIKLLNTYIDIAESLQQHMKENDIGLFDFRSSE